MVQYCFEFLNSIWSVGKTKNRKTKKYLLNCSSDNNQDQVQKTKVPSLPLPTEDYTRVEMEKVQMDLTIEPRLNQPQSSLSQSNSDASVQADGMPSQIFKLNINCVHEVCEWLPLRDLHSLAQTCKQLHRFVGEHFQRYYSAARIMCENDGIKAIGTINESISAFSQFIETVIVLNNVKNDQRFRIIASNCTESLKQIRFQTLTLTPDQIHCIETILGQIETLHFDRVKIDGDFYTDLLVHCVNLKCLSVQSAIGNMIGADNSWLHRNYPKLEYLELAHRRGGRINELDAFFLQHQQLRYLAVSYSVFFHNQDAFINSNLKLDYLALRMDDATSLDGSVCALIAEMHKRGVYREVHLYMIGLESWITQQMIMVPGLTKLYASRTIDQISFSHLVNLKEIGFYSSYDIQNIEFIAKKLVNLERIYFYAAHFDHIAPFFRHSAKLKEIEVRRLRLQDAGGYNKGIPNLTELNKQRAQLLKSQKVQIFVKEDLFIPTKWAMGTIDFSNVKMRLAEGPHFGHSFIR